MTDLNFVSLPRIEHNNVPTAKAQLVFDQSIFWRKGILPWFADLRRQAWAEDLISPIAVPMFSPPCLM